MSYILKVLEIVRNSDYKIDWAKPLNPATVSNEVKARLLPAIKHPTTGKFHTGKRGDTHHELMMTHLSADDYDTYISNYDYHDNHTGLHDPKTKKFYPSGDTDYYHWCSIRQAE